MLNNGIIDTLYIRPSMVNSEETFAPNNTNEFVLSFTIAPHKNCFISGLSAFVEQTHTRADYGGVGTAKTAGNYGRAVAAEKRAIKNGFSSVLWAKHFIQEFGTMNLFYVEDGVLFTPLLDSGLILNGITRRSLIMLAQKRKISVREVNTETSTFMSKLSKGKVSEVLGCGTASVIIPYIKIGNDSVWYKLPEVTDKSLSFVLKEDLLRVYKGEIFPEWTTSIEVIK
jgi:branched-chain amino acid aminotransferase